MVEITFTIFTQFLHGLVSNIWKEFRDEWMTDQSFCKFEKIMEGKVAKGEKCRKTARTENIGTMITVCVTFR